MKATFPKLSLLCALAILAQSIISCCGTYSCEPINPDIKLKGFKKDEADTVIIRRYNTAQSPVNDSITLGPSRTYYSTYDSSTFINFDYDSFLKPGYNYEISVPATGDKYYVTNMVEMPLEEERCFNLMGKELNCVNEVTYKLNGVRDTNLVITLIK